jgi:sugar lactone lactonase YvrE
VPQAWRMIAAILAAAALAAGGSVAYADHGPGGGSGDNGEQHDRHGEGGEPGDDHGGKGAQPGDDHGAQGQHGDDQDENDAAAAAEVYTLSEQQHGNPEGVAFDRRSGTFFVSATGDGSIYRGTLGDTATPVPVFIPGAPGQSATGMKVFRGRLYVAGAATGTIKVYDIARGDLLATFDTTGGDSSPTFVNDLDVTNRGDVYATDSFRPVIYHLPAAEIAAGTPAATPIKPADVITTSPEIPFVATAGTFNLNGIVARHEGRVDELIVVHTPTGRLFRIVVRSDNERRIRELVVKGGPFPGGDGLLIDRGRLLVVQGSADGFPNGVVNVVKLRHGARRGTLDDRLSDPSLQGPSTIARARDEYLVVNPDFATSTPPFTVTGLPREGQDGGSGPR